MENQEKANHLIKELKAIIESINKLGNSATSNPLLGLDVISSQVESLRRMVYLIEELDKYPEKENQAVAEETIPVDMKEAVGRSLENIAPEVIRKEEKEEPAPVLKKRTNASKEEKQDNSLAGKMKTKPIKDLRTAIGINEKFAFIKLFGGDATAWSNALQKLNSFSSYWEAEAHLDEYIRKYNLNEEDETLQTLKELVQRRYQ